MHYVHVNITEWTMAVIITTQLLTVDKRVSTVNTHTWTAEVDNTALAVWLYT